MAIEARRSRRCLICVLYKNERKRKKIWPKPVDDRCGIHKILPFEEGDRVDMKPVKEKMLV